MGLEQGSAQHDQCVAALFQTASGLRRTDEVVAARDLCSSQELTSGPALAECELDRVDSRPPASSAALVAVELPDRPAGTYFHATPTMVLGRERRACAALGLEVGAEPFQACVSGLAGAMDAFIWTGGG